MPALLRKPGLSEMCVIFLLNRVLIISVGPSRSLDFSDGGEKRKNETFSVGLFDVFFPHSRVPSKSHHTVCSSAGPEPRRWPPAGTSNAAWVDRHNLVMLLKEAEVSIDEGRAENLSITSISWTDVQTTREDWETSVYL